MKSIPSEYSLFRSIDVSHGMCQSLLYLWIFFFVAKPTKQFRLACVACLAWT